MTFETHNPFPCPSYNIKKINQKGFKNLYIVILSHFMNIYNQQPKVYEGL